MELDASAPLSVPDGQQQCEKEQGDPRKVLVDLSDQLNKKLHLSACGMSTIEARTLIHLVSGLKLACHTLLNSAQQLVNTFATLKVSVPVSQGPSSLPLDVYLDTRTMQMLHGPLPYFPDEDVSMNYSTAWIFIGIGTDKYHLWNYITPYATLQVTGTQFPFMRVTFNMTSAPQILYMETTEGMKAMYVKISGVNFYLVPISALNNIGMPLSGEKRIVAAKSVDISGSPAVWRDVDITTRIQCQFPINPI